jgi:hypothetical protein
MTLQKIIGIYKRLRKLGISEADAKKLVIIGYPESKYIMESI